MKNIYAAVLCNYIMRSTVGMGTRVGIWHTLLCIGITGYDIDEHRKKISTRSNFFFFTLIRAEEILLSFLSSRVTAAVLQKTRRRYLHARKVLQSSYIIIILHEWYNIGKHFSATMFIPKADSMAFHSVLGTTSKTVHVRAEFTGLT